MKNKKIIIAIVSVIILIAIAGVAIWKIFFSDASKSEESSFWDHTEAAVGLKDVKFTDYSKLLDNYKNVSDKSSKSKLNISANLDISDIDSDVKKTINNSKITVESYTDKDGKNSQNKIGLYSKNSEVLTLDLVQNNDKIGVKCDTLSDKYYTVSIDDLIDYLEEYASDSFSSDELAMLKNSFSSNVDIDPYELLYISDEDLKHLDDTYRDCFKKIIPKNCYSTEKDVEVKIGDKTVKTTGYCLTLTGSDAYNIVNDFAKLVKDDSVLSKIIAEKANLITKNMGTSSKINESDVKELMNDLFDEILTSLEEYKSDSKSAIQIVVYSDKSGLRIDFNALDDVEDSQNKETILSIVNSYNKNSDKEKSGKIELLIQENSILSLNYEIVDKDDESKLALSINVPEAELVMDINFSSKGNIEKEPVSISGSFSMKHDDESIGINFDGNMEYNDVSIPQLSSKNSVDILNLSEKEQQEELTKLMKKASEVLPTRLKLLGIDIKAEDIYKEPTTTEKPEEKENTENTNNNSESNNTSVTE